MPTVVEVRPYQSGDLPRILEITVAGFAGVSIDHRIEEQFGFVEPGWEQRKTTDVTRAVNAEPAGVFVATRDNAVVGYVTVITSPEKSLGRIADLAVDAELRNQGIGRRLLERAICYIKECGMCFAKIETLDNNAVGQALYPQLGFHEVARQIHYVMRVDDSPSD